MLLLLLLSFSEIALSQEVTYKNGDTLCCKENTYRVYVHNYETMSLAWKLVSLSDIYLLNVRNGFLNEDVRQTIWDERRELQYWEGMETEDTNGDIFGFDKIVYKHLEPWLPSLMDNRMALKCYMLFDKNGKIQELVFNLCGQSSQVSNNVWQKVSPEAVFGQMKNNMNYKRFRHFGKDKAFMDFSFFAIAFNIKKMCAKMAKEGMDGLIRLFYELTVAIFRCWGHINQRIPKNIAA